MGYKDDTTTVVEEGLRRRLTKNKIKNVKRRFSYTKYDGKKGHFTPDITLPDLKLVIECDGQHHQTDPDQKRRDATRDSELRSQGWEVIRVQNRELMHPSDLNEFVEGMKQQQKNKNFERVIEQDGKKPAKRSTRITFTKSEWKELRERIEQRDRETTPSLKDLRTRAERRQERKTLAKENSTDEYYSYCELCQEMIEPDERFCKKCGELFEKRETIRLKKQAEEAERRAKQLQEEQKRRKRGLRWFG